ncbi:type II secretion system protein GspM [Comamonas thiooxydans]|uniref:General secretion pathway protein M n=1 Tax=Comamonas thiooxydans TaxID=363952 RepID=A0A0E3CH84_9BURK|nr:type II secretion system protein GspM [Comamonas thiooxydans]KGH14522.1 general secretion pathway protein M [Comamonas thiooxydans]KGH22879.1 general secretion pathway protein M [Comamonas thiooxydans]KGH24064.1 general secretion pathway protein M [Comamonas thiooxydans]
MKQKNALKTALAPLRQRWSVLAQREQNLLLIAASVMLLALLWWVALAPALHSLRTAPARHAAAERELQNMLQMQAQAELLRQQPQGNSADARTQLEQSLKTELGSSAQLQWLGNRAQVSLSNAAAPALARWLAQVRDNSHASVAEMKLNRNLGESVDGAAVTRWGGNLLLDLPDNAGVQN